MADKVSVIRRGSNGLPFWRGLRDSYMVAGKVITIPINMSARPRVCLLNPGFPSGMLLTVADARREVGWSVSVDSTINCAHRHGTNLPRTTDCPTR